MNIAKLSVFRPIAMGMVIIFILIIGTVSLRNMPVDLFPDLTFPVAAVTVTYEGAGPEEVENLLASPLENVMGTLPNVESISSVSQNGGALILVSFEWGTDMDFATLNMREQIDAVRDTLPSEVPIPKVLRFNPSDIPIMQLGVAGSEEDLTAVKKVIEDQIKPSLDSVPGVAAVTIEGQLEKEIRLVLLVPIDEREQSDLEVAEDIRKKLKDIPNADISVSASDSGFSADPISINIIGSDLDVLKELSDDVMESISEVDGVREPTSSIESNNPEVQILIDREKAASYGIGSSQISTAISNATKGLVASNLARDGNQLDIRLAVEDKYTDSLDSLSSLLIETQTGEKVPLSAVAEIERGLGPSEITRTDRLRQVEITASLLGRDLGTVTDEIREKLVKDVPLPGNSYKITFGGQDEQMNDAFFKLSGALALAIVLVYMVMAGQFESFLYPFIIMFSVPLTAIGIIFGLLISFQPLGVGSLVGMLILTGIVVNNAIVLVDYINKLRETGMNTREAILEAGPIRLRPILMTALTTILGLVPLSLGFGEGTEIQQPMAIVIVFGLSVATFITLVFIPVVYYLIDLRRQKRLEKKMEMNQ
ncbi:efflux RND transporter permease subunit [Bacillus sp. Cs-700]|uniref:efflux RND transporter permease subunit n=1 Tax=Bacillus sp. Cs-700 TaxID=2589818 RepID=UPI00140940F5|nr:efflux RND transporter permease subunit [Bacillus sp. Cs-700]